MGEVLTGLWTAMDIAPLYFLWKSFFSPKGSKKRYVTAIVLLWVFLMVYLAFEPNQRWRIFIVVITYTLASLLVNKGAFHQHVLVALLGYCIGIAMNNIFCYGISAILGISVEELVWRKILFTVVVTTGRITTILVDWYIGHLWKQQKMSPLHGKWMLLTLLFFASSAAMLYITFLKFQNTNGLPSEIAMFSLVLVAANVVFFILADTLAKSTEKLKETALLNQQMELQTEQILALKESYQAQRKRTHDFRNQLQAISELLSMGKTEQAESYVHQLLGQQTGRIFAVNTGHPVIDAVLNHKYHLCQEQAVDIHFKVNDLQQVKLPTDMLVVLLSNLLDNAIEGCCRVQEERTIFCSILAKDTLFISVRNTSLPVTIQNGRIQTSKASKEEHGYGLGRISYILDALEGEYSFQYKDGWFTYVAEIPLM